MTGYFKKLFVLFGWKDKQHLLCLLILLAATYLCFGCTTPIKQLYEIPEAGISLEKPANWKVTFNERNGMVVLVAKNGVWDKVSARIEIQGPACFSLPNGFQNSSEEIKWNIDRIRMLYSLDSISIVQEPISVENANRDTFQAIIELPVLALADDPTRIQVRGQGSGYVQVIELFAIAHNENKVMVYIYDGDSETLNEQAKDIIYSVEIDCPGE